MTDFLKRCFEKWYAEQITKLLEGQDIETAALQPIDLGLPILKEGAGGKVDGGVSRLL